MIDIGSAFEAEKPKLLLVASTGGHLEQLVRFARASAICEESLFVTFPSPQADSLLEGLRSVEIPDVPTRDWRGALRAVGRIRRILERERFDGVVSTGAAVAVSAFVAARLTRVKTLYIESVSRVEGPSLSGRIVANSRLARELWTQHKRWANRRWTYHGSVLDTYRSTPKTDRSESSIFVTVGTLKKFRFDAMLDGVLATGLPDDSTVWQVGTTTRRGLPGTVLDFVPSSRFDELARAAEIVVSHAGVGSVLRLLNLGIYPVLVVRRKSRGEQIDDHQAQIAGLMKANDLAVVVEADQITADILLGAAHRKIVLVEDALDDD